MKNQCSNYLLYYIIVNNKYLMNKLIKICSNFFNDKNLTDELIDICCKYKNITKSEMKQINFKIYTKNNFLNINKYCLVAMYQCCRNNNLLGPKYFVKRYGITKDEIMIYGSTCLHVVCLYQRLSFIKYLINTYNLMKNDFMNIDKHNNNCLHLFFTYNNINKLRYKIFVYIFNKYNFTKNELMIKNNSQYTCLHFLFSHYGTHKLHYKICVYILNKYNFTKNGVLVKNNSGSDLLSFCCVGKQYKLLKYLIIKHKFTENDLKYLKQFNSDIKINKILLINNLLIIKKYNKIFDLIYK